MASLAKAVVAVLDALGVDWRKIVAWAVGGAVALTLFLMMLPLLALGALFGGGAAGLPPALGLWATGLVAQEAGSVPMALVLAVIDHESGGLWMATHRNPNHTTDAGLMQVNSANWAAYGLTGDPYAPAANVRAGVAILAGALARYPRNVAGALEAYNAGTAANGWAFDPGYAGAVLAALHAILAGPHLAAERIAGGGKVLVTAYAPYRPPQPLAGSATVTGLVPPGSLTATGGGGTNPVLPCGPGDGITGGVVPSGAVCWVAAAATTRVTAVWRYVVTTKKTTTGPHGTVHTVTTKRTVVVPVTVGVGGAALRGGG